MKYRDALTIQVIKGYQDGWGIFILVNKANGIILKGGGNGVKLAVKLQFQFGIIRLGDQLPVLSGDISEGLQGPEMFCCKDSKQFLSGRSCDRIGVLIFELTVEFDSFSGFN